MESKTLNQIAKIVVSNGHDHSNITECRTSALHLIEDLIGESEMYIEAFLAGYEAALEYGCPLPKPEVVKVVLVESQSYTVHDMYLLKEA